MVGYDGELWTLCSGQSSETSDCNTYPCPVDGGWGSWSPYSPCSKICGGGDKERTRQCNNPIPLHGGAVCSGESNQIESCNLQACAKDGGWGSWSSYSPCSRTCGGGEKRRTRQCDNPAPSDGGAECSGPSNQIESCALQACPVDGGWGAWSTYSSCSKTCGGGEKERTRQCDNPTPSNGGAGCLGTSSERSNCNPQTCPRDGKWGSWGSWSTCSKTCDDGWKTRTRLCDNPTPAHGGAMCPGSSSVTSRCSLRRCLRRLLLF